MARHFALRKYKKTHKPDITFAIGKVASISNILSKRRGERCVASLHGFTSVPTTKLLAFGNKILFGFADAILCGSKGMAAEFIKATGMRSDNIFACANPFDVPTLMEKSNETEGIPTLAGSPKLFAFGRIVEGKNFELAIEATQQLVAEYPNIHLSICGGGEHTPALQDMARSLGIAQHVTFLGILPNPFGALRQADIMLNPSWNEGFCNAVVESFLCGVPVIATDCKVGPRESIAPNSDIMKISAEIEFEEYGVLVPPSYPNDTPTQRTAKAAVMADAIRALLKDDALRAAYAAKGKARMSHYTLPHYVTQVVAMLEG